MFTYSRMTVIIKIKVATGRQYSGVVRMYSVMTLVTQTALCCLLDV